MYTKLYRTVSYTFVFLGALCIASGVALPHLMKYDNSRVHKLDVTVHHVKKLKSNVIKLKNIEIQVGNSLSVDPKEYLEKTEDIDDFILKSLKLDISNVNVNEPGSYTYTVTANKKIYNGTVSVLKKPLPQVDMTLIPLTLEIDQEIPTDVTKYIKENLSDEVKANIKLDTSNVNNKQVGNYLYSISYNGKFYTSTITINEKKVILSEKEEEKTAS